MNDSKIIEALIRAAKALAAAAYQTRDPLAEIDVARHAARGAVIKEALEAENWFLHRAAARLGRTTSTIQSELQNHHPEIESERKRRLAER